MKLLAAIAGLFVVAIAALLLWPRLAPHPAPVDASGHNALSQTSSSEAPRPDRPLEAPRTHEEEVRDEFARKRLPFYRYLHENYGDVIDHFGVTDSLDTLDLVMLKSDDATLQRIVSEAVGPHAQEYGFTHIRFYTPNPPGSPAPATLIAESTYDPSGHWNTFKK